MSIRPQETGQSGGAQWLEADLLLPAVGKATRGLKRGTQLLIRPLVRTMAAFSWSRRG
jgi:hypothetical protein